MVHRAEAAKIVDQAVDDIALRLRMHDDSCAGDRGEQCSRRVRSVANNTRTDDRWIVSPTLDDPSAFSLHLTHCRRERALGRLDDDEQTRQRAPRAAG